MTKKVYLYDSYGYDFYACEYEGLDADGKPRLTIMTPGQPVENFKERLEETGESIYDYYLLCEGGKQADPASVVEMLGVIFLYSGQQNKRIPARLEEMRKYGIDYSRELQKLTVTISELAVESPLDEKYRLSMSVGDRDRYIGECRDFKYLNELLSKLCNFIYLVEDRAGIPLKKKLRADGDMMKQIKKKMSNLFDEYEEE